MERPGYWKNSVCVLETETRALCMLSLWSPTEQHPQPPQGEFYPESRTHTDYIGIMLERELFYQSSKQQPGVRR